MSAPERALLRRAGDVDDALVLSTRTAIACGEDPLGASFCALRSAVDRRRRGATYTPISIVTAMLDWSTTARPVRVVDPGTGSARFLVHAAARWPRAQLLGVELDPLAALTARANLAAAGLAQRAAIHLADYRAFELPPVDGPTLFAGNPPYVRHHDIAPSWKQWLTQRAAGYGLSSSQLAGLHVHFFVATLAHARAGDYGAFITASEWLDVNYGALVRELLCGPLGLERIDLIDPTVEPFADAQATAVITCFRVGAAPAVVKVRKVDSLAELSPLAGGRSIARARLAASQRWTNLRHARNRSGDLIELGELCRVHRGQVTGANAVWIAAAHTPGLPDTVLRPAVTKARELFAAAGALRATEQLRRVVDLPRDLDELSVRERKLVDEFLSWAREAGAHERYVARHRKPWWAVRLRTPAPILATYMARRPPAFVRNLAGARHINIAHGLYPRDPLSHACLDALAAYLARTVSTGQGRTYAGGLTKFEPKEMERLLVPSRVVLEQLAAERASPAQRSARANPQAS